MVLTPHVFVLGRATLDLLIKCPPGIGIDQLKLLPEYQMLPGGSGVNTAIALSFLGAKVSLCTRVGSDFAGQFVLQWLRSRGIQPSNWIQDPVLSTFLSIVSVADNGEVGIRQHVGANDALCAQDIALEAMESTRVFHLSGAFSMKSLDGPPAAELLRRAKDLGKLTAVSVTRNTANKDTLLPSLRHVDYLIWKCSPRRIPIWP